MTTFCRIVLTVVSCTVDPTPAPTPADAVAILRASSPPFQAVTEIEPRPQFLHRPELDKSSRLDGPVHIAKPGEFVVIGGAAGADKLA